jgi:hypothetical protein
MGKRRDVEIQKLKQESALGKTVILVSLVVVLGLAVYHFLTGGTIG